MRIAAVLVLIGAAVAGSLFLYSRPLPPGRHTARAPVRRERRPARKIDRSERLLVERPISIT